MYDRVMTFSLKPMRENPKMPKHAIPLTHSIQAERDSLGSTASVCVCVCVVVCVSVTYLVVLTHIILCKEKLVFQILIGGNSRQEIVIT